MNEWRETWFEVIAIVEMGQSPKGATCNSSGDGIPLLNGPTEFGIKCPAPIQFTTDPKKTSLEGDLLFCVRGSTTGRMNWADKPYAIGRGVAAIRHKEGTEYNRYIRGLLEYNLSHLLSSATGSTFPNVSRNQLERLEILLPPLPEQKAIAEVLSSLDDKIDLLHRQNKTLEAMAETLFRQWFVEEAKEDWDELKIRDIANHLKINVKTNTNSVENYWHYSLPAFDEEQMPKSELGATILSNKYKVLPNSILVSKLNPRFPRIWAIGGDISNNAICSTEFQVFQPNRDDYFGFLFFLFKSNDAREELEMAASGTSGSHQRVRPEDILNITFSAPSTDYLVKYSNLVQPNILKIETNKSQIKTLEKLRDSLLPKLMSGEIKIKNA